MQIIKETKFKSSYITINYITDLKKDELTENVIWIKTLLKGTKNYPNSLEIDRKFANLYASSYSVNLEKLNNLLAIRFRLEVLNSKYLPNNEDVLDEALSLMHEIIYNPLIVNDGFEKSIVEKEKHSLMQIINSRKDDKKEYALTKCDELLSENPENEYIYGNLNDLEKVTEYSAYKQYKKIINNASVNIIATGDINDNVENLIKKYFKEKDNKHYLKINNNVNFQIQEEFEYDNSMQQMIVVQGAKIKEYKKEDMFKYMIYNSILGSGSTSKLFRNVREKESLAYYTFSKFSRFNSNLIICTGILPKNLDKTLKTINQQLINISEGKVSDEEFKTAKMLIKNNLIEFYDSQYMIDSFNFYNLLYHGEYINLEDYIAEIDNIKKQDVIDVSNNIILTSLFVIGRKNNE